MSTKKSTRETKVCEKKKKEINSCVCVMTVISQCKFGWITLQVRMQATGSQSKCDNMLCSFVHIYKTEGVGGLWRVSGVLSDGSDFNIFRFFSLKLGGVLC